jgi:3-isopropylmalate dehydrogenase
LQTKSDLVRSGWRWSDAVVREPRPAPSERFSIAALPGEGVGPDVVAAALEVLSAVSLGGARFDVSTGGPIGRDAELATGRPLTEEVESFCAGAFAAGGAVLAGAGGGRFVYDLRRRFDLYCKISPLQPRGPLREAGRLKPEAVAGADVLIVRENTGGEYLGTWDESRDERGRVCRHSFEYDEARVRRLLDAAARLAAARTGRLAVAVKDAGLPAVSALWRDIAKEAAERSGVALRVLDIDLVAYLLLQDPLGFDVVAASNLFGDVLADLGAVLLGSRGVSFSGNYSEDGAAVYQTNHGSALDLAGSDRANPIGQILALAMLLRESFGLRREAAWVEEGVDEVLRHGFRTFDVAAAGTTVVGTAEMGGRIARAVERRARWAE